MMCLLSGELQLGTAAGRLGFCGREGGGEAGRTERRPACQRRACTGVQQPVPRVRCAAAPAAGAPHPVGVAVQAEHPVLPLLVVDQGAGGAEDLLAVVALLEQRLHQLLPAGAGRAAAGRQPRRCRQESPGAARAPPALAWRPTLAGGCCPRCGRVTAAPTHPQWLQGAVPKEKSTLQPSEAPAREQAAAARSPQRGGRGDNRGPAKQEMPHLRAERSRTWPRSS
jgi:hypothetical protein